MINAQDGHACASVSSKSPSAASLVQPLIKILGRACNFSIKKSTKRADAILLVGTEVGIEVEDSKGKHETFSHRVDQAFWLGRSRSQPLFGMLGRGSWSLTQFGVTHARKLNGKNLTAEYLDQRIKATGGLKGTLWNLLRWAVARKLPPSAVSGLVDDHIHNCMMRLISRDSLRNKLLRGEKIPDTLLASYAVRAAYTDIRDWGTNPVTREMYGARTEREREKKIVLPPISDPRVIWNIDKNPEDPPIDIAGDPRGFGGAISLEEAIDFQVYLDCLDDLIERKYPNKQEDFRNVIDLKMQGCNLPEILAAVPISPRHANQMLNEARACIRRVQSRAR